MVYNTETVALFPIIHNEQVPELSACIPKFRAVGPIAGTAELQSKKIKFFKKIATTYPSLIGWRCELNFELSYNWRILLTFISSPDLSTLEQVRNFLHSLFESYCSKTFT